MVQDPPPSTRTSAADPIDAAAQPPTMNSRDIRPFNRLAWGQLPVVIRRALIIIGLVVVWQLYVSLFNVSPLLVASPASVARSFSDGLVNGELLTSTTTTLQMLLSGMAIGLVGAMLFTTLALSWKFGEDLLLTLTSIINPLPSVAILPLAILWLGLSPKALILIITNAVIWPIAINVHTGFKTINVTILAVARNIGLGRTRYVLEVLAPAALPDIIAGLKTAWAYAWRTIIAAELIFGVAGGEGGLGYFINQSRYYLRIPDVFAGLVTIALIGVLVDALFGLVERKTVVKWGMVT